MTCEGYKTRLTWGPSNTATSTGAGVVLNPVRQPRAKTRSSRNRDVGNTGESMPDLPLDMPEFTSGQSPDELDLLCLQFESLSEELPDEDVAKILMESCEKRLRYM